MKCEVHCDFQLQVRGMWDESDVQMTEELSAKARIYYDS